MLGPRLSANQSTIQLIIKRDFNTIKRRKNVRNIKPAGKMRLNAFACKEELEAVGFFSFSIYWMQHTINVCVYTYFK